MLVDEGDAAAGRPWTEVSSWGTPDAASSAGELVAGRSARGGQREHGGALRVRHPGDVQALAARAGDPGVGAMGAAGHDPLDAR
jgi:hypothetical protein